MCLKYFANYSLVYICIFLPSGTCWLVMKELDLMSVVIHLGILFSCTKNYGGSANGSAFCPEAQLDVE
jgi:hypothetical protein